MSKLTKFTVKEIESNRRKCALNFAEKHKCILLLKGSKSVIASDKGKVYINRTGNSGMATAGSGDVLTGMIAAFLGQGLNGFDAAKIACFLHGKAGDLAAKSKTKLSMIASDIIDYIPKAVKDA